MPITTTTEYKTYAGIGSTDWDTFIDVAIGAIQAQLERVCGRAFDETTYTDEAYDGNGECSLWLPNTPVTALTAVKELDSSGTESTVASTSYRLNGDTGEIRRLSSDSIGWDNGYNSLGLATMNIPAWPKGMQNILVTYTAGYSDGNAPDDLKDLVHVMVDAVMDNRRENWTLAQGGDGVVQRVNRAAADKAQEYAEMIRPWRRVVV